MREAEKAKGWGFFPRPAVPLSQLVEGDGESFHLALGDALEAHRDHYQVADRADDADASLNLAILALACHARRRGWEIRVESPYLPQRLLLAAEPSEGALTFQVRQAMGRLRQLSSAIPRGDVRGRDWQGRRRPAHRRSAPVTHH